MDITTRTTPVVLVADDEPSMLALVARHIKTLGYQVLEASDGDAAWQEAARVLPDLVVLDVMMPGMSGWEVCRRIRENVGLAHTGVIMLTGIGQSLNELTSPLYGADAYIDKPFEFRDLDEKITKVLTARGHSAIEIEPPPVSMDSADDEPEEAEPGGGADEAIAEGADERDDLEPPTLDLPGASKAVAVPAATMSVDGQLASIDALAELGKAKADEEDEFSLALTLRPPPKHGAAAGAPLPRPAPVASITIDDDAPAKGPSAPAKKAAKKVVKKPAKKAAKKVVKKPAKKAAKKTAKKPAKNAVKKPAKKVVKKAAKKAAKKPAKNAVKKPAKKVAKKAAKKTAKKPAKKATRKARR